MFELLLLAIAAVPAVFYCSNVRRRWWFLDPINTFWPVYLLFGVVQPWASRDGWIDVYGEPTLYWTLILYVLVGVTVSIGYALPVGRRVAGKLPLVRGEDDESHYLLVGFVFLAVGAIAYAYVIRVSGGIQQFLSASRTAINRDELTGYTLTLLTLVPLGLTILLACTCSHRRYTILKRLALGATMIFGLWCIYSGTRSGIISVALIVLGSIYGAQRRNPPLHIMAAAVAAIVTLVGFIAQYRGEIYGGQFHSTENAAAILDKSMEFYTQTDQTSAPLGSEFGMSLAVVSYVPNTVPYDYGYMLLDFFTMPVPRAWWPEKFYPGGDSWDRVHRVAGTAGWINDAGKLSGPAPSLVGKYFYIGGTLGVLFGGLWTGVFLQLIRSYVSRYTGVTGVLLAVGCFNLGFSEMNNPLAWPISWIPAVGAGILIAAWLGRRRRHTIPGLGSHWRRLRPGVPAPSPGGARP